MRKGPPLAVVHNRQSQPESAMLKTSTPVPLDPARTVHGNTRSAG